MTGRLPSYGRDLQTKRGQRRVWWGNDQVCILVGSDAWAQAREWRASRLILLCPPDENPAAFDWSQVATTNPPIVFPCGDFDPAQIDLLAAELLRTGCRTVAVAYDVGWVWYRAEAA